MTNEQYLEAPAEAGELHKQCLTPDVAVPPGTFSGGDELPPLPPGTFHS